MIVDNIGDFVVKHVIGFIAFDKIGDNDRPGWKPVLLHKFAYGNLERLNIKTVTIIDNQAVVDTILEFKTHFKRDNFRQAFLKIGNVVYEKVYECEAMGNVFHRSGVAEKIGKILDFLFGVFRTPANKPLVRISLFKSLFNIIIVRTIEDYFRVFEQFYLFIYHFICRLEVLQMGCSYVGNDTHSGAYHFFKALHFAFLGDSSFDYSQLRIQGKSEN